MKKCPECDSVIDEPSMGFCANCGRELDGSEHSVQEASVQPVKRSTKHIALSLVAILLVSGIGGLLFVGGVVDFEYDYDDNGDMAFTNTSTGILKGYKWDFTGDNGTLNGSVVVVGDHATLHGTQPSVFTVTLYAYTQIGVEKKTSKEITEPGLRGHAVEWRYLGNDYVIEYSVAVSDYKMYKGSNVDRWPGDRATSDLVAEYMRTETSNDAFESIVDQLIARSPGVTKEENANFIMSFVQQLSYIYDSTSTGSNEYWRYAVETLFVGGGDCEDVSILCMALFEAFFEGDVDTALILYWPKTAYNTEGHAMAGIVLDSMPGNPNQPAFNTKITGYPVNGKTYYVCECTNVPENSAIRYTVGIITPKTSYVYVAPDHILTV